MSDFNCKTCGEFMVRPEIHRCPPEWECWCEDYGQKREDARKVRAHNADSAAEAWAAYEDTNSAEYNIAGGSAVTVYVVQSDAETGTKPRRFNVEGEAVPSYTAYEQGDPESGDDEE